MKFNELFKVFPIILVIGFLVFSYLTVCDWIAADDNTNDTITTDNDGNEIARRYHHRSNTARFFNRG